MNNIKYQLIDKKYRSLVDDIERYFDASNCIVYEDRNKIKLVVFNQQKLVIKSFRHPSLLNRFIYTFVRDSKANRAFNYALKLAQFTPKPIAYIEQYPFGLIKKSYLITENFDFDFDMNQPLTQDDFPNNKALFQQFAHFIYQLHKNNIVHLDFWNGNILVKKQAENYQFNIVDINRMRFQPLNLTMRAKNFIRLNITQSNLVNLIQYYAKLSNIDEDHFLKLVIDYRLQFVKQKVRKQKIKNFFKKT